MPKADEVISVRLPKGMADELRAATGQPLSRVVRWVMTALLEKKRAERAAALNDGQMEVRQVVDGLEGEPTED